MEIDLDNLKVFISKLDDFCEQLGASARSVQRATSDMAGSWNDEVFQRFSGEMEAQLGDLLKVTSAGQSYKEHLNRLYAAGMEYLSCR